MTEPLIQVEELQTSLITARGFYYAVRGVSFELNKGEIVGLVGESGSGKSMTAKSILRLNDEKHTFYHGQIRYCRDGKWIDLLQEDKKTIHALRGTEIAMITQNPMSAFDPLCTIGDQIMEMLIFHRKLSKEEAVRETVRLLELVGISPGEERLAQYPHEMSGGMLQRAAIAMMISCQPKVLIADEPTTALDVTMQAQILSILKELRDRLDIGILVITHNFGVVAEICDRVCVMYAGQIVESNGVDEIFQRPAHPYTKALMESIPGREGAAGRLTTIPGVPPVLNRPIEGCAFAPRCSYASKKCEQPGFACPESGQPGDAQAWCARPESRQPGDKQQECIRSEGADAKQSQGWCMCNLAQRGIQI